MTAPCKEYQTYEDFTNEFLVEAMMNEYAAIVVDYRDAAGIIQSFHRKQINNQSCYLNRECYDLFDEDIATAKSGSGMMMITVMGNGEIISEPVIYDSPDAYLSGIYFVECDAKKFATLPISGMTVPFQIAKKVI